MMAGRKIGARAQLALKITRTATNCLFFLFILSPTSSHYLDDQLRVSTIYLDVSIIVIFAAVTLMGIVSWWVVDEDKWLSRRALGRVGVETERVDTEGDLVNKGVKAPGHKGHIYTDAQAQLDSTAELSRD